MKKLHLVLVLSIAFIVTCSTVFISCNRTSSEIAPTQTANPNANARLVDDGEKNYCKGCGSAYSSGWSCNHRTCVSDGGCLIVPIGDNFPENDPDVTSMLNAGYDLRDNFLINYDVSQMYITYYYELSAIAIDNNLVTTSNYMDWFTFGNELLTAAAMIRTGNATDVPIDSALRTKILGYITLFRNNTTDTVILGYLDNIEDDLDDITGKTVAYIQAKLAA